MRRILFVCFLFSSILLFTSRFSGAEEIPFNTIRLKGKDYINLADVQKSYRLKKSFSKKAGRITLKNKTKSIQLKLNSPECVFQGVRLLLSTPILEYRNSTLISKIDVHKILDPLLRPTSMKRHKVETIFLDPGHGGIDSGSIGFRKSQEKNLTLDLTFRVEKLLKKEGFKTLMTRRSDTFISKEDRSELVNASDADLFLSLHLNSARPRRDPNGVETYYLAPPGMSCANTLRKYLWREEPGNQFDSYNILLAYLIHQQITHRVSKIQDRGIKRDIYRVIRTTQMPCVLVESGFLSNPLEENRLLTPKYRQQLAITIAEGIKRYALLMKSLSLS